MPQPRICRGRLLERFYRNSPRCASPSALAAGRCKLAAELSDARSASSIAGCPTHTRGLFTLRPVYQGQLHLARLASACQAITRYAPAQYCLCQTAPCNGNSYANLHSTGLSTGKRLPLAASLMCLPLTDAQQHVRGLRDRQAASARAGSQGPTRCRCSANLAVAQLLTAGPPQAAANSIVHISRGRHLPRPREISLIGESERMKQV